MPMYEYYCEKCDETFTAIRKVEDRREEIECPVCGNKTNDLQISKTEVYINGKDYYQRGFSK